MIRFKFGVRGILVAKNGRGVGAYEDGARFLTVRSGTKHLAAQPGACRADRDVAIRHRACRAEIYTELSVGGLWGNLRTVSGFPGNQRRVEHQIMRAALANAAVRSEQEMLANVAKARAAEPAFGALLDASIDVFGPPAAFHLDIAGERVAEWSSLRQGPRRNSPGRAL